MKKEDLLNGSKLFYIDHETNKEEYAIYSYTQVIFQNGNVIGIEKYDDNLKYIPNHQYDIIRVENPFSYITIEREDKEYEDIEEISYKYVNTYGNISQHRKSEEPLIDTINALIRNQKYILERLENKK